MNLKGLIPRGLGTLIFSYIRQLGPFFGDQNFEFQFFEVFRKMNIFLGIKILCIFFRGYHKLGLVLGSFLCMYENIRVHPHHTTPGLYVTSS